MRIGLGRRPTGIFVLTMTLALTVLPAPAALADHGTVLCPQGQTCEFPSPQDCAAGDHTGVWNGGEPPGRGSVCVGAAGHNALYVGGEPTQLCGAVIVGDLNVVDGPTTSNSSDPNKCPHFGWGTQVHDPVIAKLDGVYYLFGTGAGTPIWRSTDLRTWHPSGRVFADDAPAWGASAVPGSGVPWAPDVSFFSGRWHLYYSISVFATKNSAIGLSTNPTLDPGDPRYRWTDHGIVVQSGDTTDYNAIDPNIFLDEQGRPWLDFGSFFSGIKLAAIDPATGKLAEPTLRPLASRVGPTWGIEAPFVVRRGGYHYLFVSFDNCCRGSESTYNIRVGRSETLAGTYVDDRSVPMLLGGGRLVLEGAGDRRGPGHNAVLRDGDDWWLVFHYYDAADNGIAKLGILPIHWTQDGWPEVDWSELVPTSFVARDGSVGDETAASENADAPAGEATNAGGPDNVAVLGAAARTNRSKPVLPQTGAEAFSLLLIGSGLLAAGRLLQGRRRN